MGGGGVLPGSAVRSVRAPVVDWAAWGAAAEAAGLSLNAWLVRAARDQVELERALRGLAEAGSSPGALRPAGSRGTG
jgi:hypothetical protein